MNLNLKAVGIIISLFVILQSCEKEEGGQGTNISDFNTTSSHNMGKNCMICHTPGGEGYGYFNIAGTVYNNLYTSTFQNAKIRLYTEQNGGGTLKYTINGDANGNFFTTEPIDFGTGLYPSVEGSTQTNYMSTAITTGECNSCHNISTNKIWTN